MQLGTVRQVVKVTAETPLLQAETSSLGQVVEQRKANELLSNGRVNTRALLHLHYDRVFQQGFPCSRSE